MRPLRCLNWVKVNPVHSSHYFLSCVIPLGHSLQDTWILLQRKIFTECEVILSPWDFSTELRSTLSIPPIITCTACAILLSRTFLLRNMNATVEKTVWSNEISWLIMSTLSIPWKIHNTRTESKVMSPQKFLNLLKVDIIHSSRFYLTHTTS